MFIFFFFNDTATTEIYTLSLHDALPISNRWTTILDMAGQHVVSTKTIRRDLAALMEAGFPLYDERYDGKVYWRDRKSTRLNSSHSQISYAVFCLKKKKLFSHHSLYRSEA